MSFRYHSKRPEDGVVRQHPTLLGEPRRILLLLDAPVPAEGRKDVAHQGGADADAGHDAERDEAEIVVAGAIFAGFGVVVRELQKLGRQGAGRGEVEVRDEKRGDGVECDACSFMMRMSALAAPDLRERESGNHRQLGGEMDGQHLFFFITYRPGCQTTIGRPSPVSPFRLSCPSFSTSSCSSGALAGRLTHDPVAARRRRSSGPYSAPFRFVRSCPKKGRSRCQESSFHGGE